MKRDDEPFSEFSLLHRREDPEPPQAYWFGPGEDEDALITWGELAALGACFAIVVGILGWVLVS